MPAPIGNTFYKLATNPGRPKDIPTAEDMWQLFTVYRQWAKDNPVLVQDFVGKDADEVERKKERPLTLEGFEDWVADNGGPWSLDHYFGNYEGRYEEFISVCARIRRSIRSDQITGGMAGIYNPSITQRLNNLVERTENNNKITLDQLDYSQLSDEALKEIEDASKNQPRLS
jgi:hypothetical protein